MKILFILCHFFLLSLYTQAQPYGITIKGGTVAWEGSTMQYTVMYTGSASIPTGTTLAFTSVENGTEIASQVNLFNGQPVSITVQWNCLAKLGRITGVIYNSAGTELYTYTHNVALLTYSNYPDMCNEITPQEQAVFYNEVPQILSVSNCSPYCESSYGFSYQWQYADVIESEGISEIPETDWHEILSDGTGSTYQPPAMVVYGIKAYRRITTYDDPLIDFPVTTITKKSKPSYVKFTTRLDPGSISTGTTIFHDFHHVPVFSSTPAIGGLCEAVNYVYTWQSTNSNGQWEDIGTGESFPANTEEISYTKRYRRKIQCGTEIKYSNVVTIYFNYISANTENRNYVREVDVKVPGATTWNQVDGDLAIGEKLQNTAYLDAFGRPIQNVSRETATPVNSNDPWADNVQYFSYDAFGRQPYQYLPFSTSNDLGKFKETASGDYSGYYASHYPEDASWAYSSNTYDISPLNRVINTKNPGKAWQNGLGNSENVDYPFNGGAEVIPMISVGTGINDIPVYNGLYKGGTLLKSTVIDEDESKIVTYTNTAGLVVMKKVQLEDETSNVNSNGWILTYYVYDDFGRLRYTLEPKAIKKFEEKDWDFNVSVCRQTLDALCFKYAYDERGNMIIKKTPGNEPLRMVYDLRNRLILSQDGNLRSTINKPIPQCHLTLYDELDRPTMQILLTLSEHTIEGYESAILAAEPDNIYHNIFESVVNQSSVCTVLKYFYYDGYSFGSVKSFFGSFNNQQAYPGNTPGIEPIVSSLRVKGFLTGTKVLVMDNSGLYLNSTSYYDEDGRPVQALTDNITSSVAGFPVDDIVTNQYYWDGRLLSSETKHSAAGTPFDRYSILTKNTYDKIGRLAGIYKKIGDNSFKAIEALEYDEMGRVKIKHLAPDYTGTNGEPDVETINYSYNIQGRLEGMNKDYALKTPGLYNKWGNSSGKFFGFYLGFDQRSDLNLPNLFDRGLLTGQVAAQVWTTMGDEVQRKYEYGYDRAGRLKEALFAQRRDESENWANGVLDYSVKGDDPNHKIDYDLNGNILSMWHKGIFIGVAGTSDIDQLYYSYKPLQGNPNQIEGNRLVGVKDAIGSSADNGKLGDFKDDADENQSDYEYDDNGNLLFDKNKGIKDVTGGSTTLLGNSGIRYNIFDKPEEIHIDGKGTVTYLYDADGNKLKRSFQAEGSSEVNTTTYINQFIYTDRTEVGNVPQIKLSYINFEEGRIRVMNNISMTEPPGAPGQPNPDPLDYLQVNGSIELFPNNPLPGFSGVYDYFLKDNLQNVRMIVTEEEHLGGNTCTLESSRMTNEQMFSSPTTINKNAIPNNGATAWTMNTYGTQVVKLSKTGTKVGSKVLLKVMAGDELSARTKYFYNELPNNTAGLSDVVGDMLDALAGSLLTSSQVPGEAKAQLISHNNVGQMNAIQGIKDIAAPDENEAGTDIPKAYLTMLFFDERFSFVEGQSIRVNDNQQDELPLTEIKAPRNGYVYVYVSNESNTPVYFDDLEVLDKRGRIVEENHYYPFGLKIATLSSVKGADVNEGEIKNQHQYQGEYNEFEEELGWNDFALRNYDPQIGRWLQNDPYDEFSSGYMGMGNDPINNIDPTGGSSWDWFRKLSDDQSYWSYQWFEGKGQGDCVGEGWEWIGKEKAGFRTRSGYWAELRPDGTVYWMEFGIQKKMPESPYTKEFLSKDHGEIKPYTPKKNFAQKWDSFNDSWVKWTPIGWTSIIAYNTIDGVKTFGSAVVNGWRDATNLKGENLINTYGAEASMKMRMNASVTVLTMPFGAIEAGEISQVENGMGRVFHSGAGMESKAAQMGQTLGSTRAGRNLQKLIESKNIPWEEANYMWQRLSKVWAKGVPEGSTVPVFLKNVRADATWLHTELPILLEKNVNLIKFNYK